MKEKFASNKTTSNLEKEFYAANNEIIENFYTGRVRIAKGVMGFLTERTNEHENYTEVIGVSSLSYDQSWDELKPVIDKLFSLWVSAGRDTFQKAFNLRLHAFLRKNPINSELHFVYKNVVALIKWYNSNKPK